MTLGTPVRTLDAPPPGATVALGVPAVAAPAPPPAGDDADPTPPNTEDAR
ncbi:hypothetical protein [Streptomyces sp. SBT349]|nr:hypothetical protein [Streptomyces sp. SBT349]